MNDYWLAVEERLRPFGYSLATAINGAMARGFVGEHRIMAALSDALAAAERGFPAGLYRMVRADPYFPLEHREVPTRGDWKWLEREYDARDLIFKNCRLLVREAGIKMSDEARVFGIMCDAMVFSCDVYGGGSVSDHIKALAERPWREREAALEAIQRARASRSPEDLAEEAARRSAPKPQRAKTGRPRTPDWKARMKIAAKKNSGRAI